MVDFTLPEWNQWSECVPGSTNPSTTAGHRIRYRECPAERETIQTARRPLSCSGSTERVQRENCSGHMITEWESWGSWNKECPTKQCETTEDERIQTRNRNCKMNTEKMYPCFEKTLDQNICNDIDEYSDGSSQCGENTFCINTEFCYECPCKSYEYRRKDNFTCEDINECDNPDACDSTISTCKNLDGSFECECREGFKKDSQGSCQDINECENPDTNDCDRNAKCKNEKGTYKCICQKGYQGDGQTCHGI